MESRNHPQSIGPESGLLGQRKSGQEAQGVSSSQGPALQRLSVNDLARCCAEETSKFLKQSVSNDRYCLELFRRAIVKRDDDAWACIYQQYAPLVLTWVTQHQSAAPVLGQDGGAPLVNAAFAKFSQALTPAKMDNFDSLAAILKYLKMCVHSVVADEVRSRQSRQYEETLELIEHEPASDDPADDVVSNISAQGLWQVIQEELNGEDERILIYLAYIQGMKPSEISSQHRRLFPTVDDVYRIKRNVLERLRRNRRLQTMFKHNHL
ncbi:MAG TPA: sigma-70 family RNA polymerase sigma factor [Ktedonobacteraceae bacterium]|nr:sigma-70 family RNA polymerase sigma factor [Ktedonobacteraceae bacterium]